ncbi:aminotransferase class I/II-fold pyridoxal phosphate-dependent enzyme [Bradyrhizobium diazoefficiens]|nr:aminotransferase class I/II-fold pyridoxal phosphate-dependent enzyme [Bradyrhizobium diazoefficiens]
MPPARLILTNTLTRFVLGNADHRIIFYECCRAFAHTSDAHHLVISVASRVRGRTLMVNSLSKSLALIGMRIGYLSGLKVVTGAVNALQPYNIQSSRWLWRCGRHTSRAATLRRMVYEVAQRKTLGPG